MIPERSDYSGNKVVAELAFGQCCGINHARVRRMSAVNAD